MAKLNNDQASTAVWFAGGVLIALGSLQYGVGSLASPGSGFITFVAALSMCFFSLVGMIAATRSREGWRPVMKSSRWKKTFLVMGMLAAYAFFLPSLGFLLCTAIFVGVMLRAVEPQPWMVVIAGAVLAALGSYGVFEVWLQAQLPRGFLGF